MWCNSWKKNSHRGIRARDSGIDFDLKTRQGFDFQSAVKQDQNENKPWRFQGTAALTIYVSTPVFLESGSFNTTVTAPSFHKGFRHTVSSQCFSLNSNKSTGCVTVTPGSVSLPPRRLAHGLTYTYIHSSFAFQDAFPLPSPPF